jgi:imidazolonepropionase-like amidohydrolase
MPALCRRLAFGYDCRRMKKLILAAGFSLVASLGTAQNLVITNARILDGKGGVIERGTVVVQNGTVASVSAAAAPALAGARVIDAKGMTVMPGFIDAHRHIIRGNPAQWLKEEAAPRMREFLEAGFTTVLSAGDATDQIIELRRRTESGDIAGPRIIALGRVGLTAPAGGGRAAGPPPAAAPPAGGRGAAPAAPPAGGRGGFNDGARRDRFRTAPANGEQAPSAEQTKAAVAAVSRAGFDGIKAMIQVWPNGVQVEALRQVVIEAKAFKLPVMTHATSVEDTLGAVEARTDVLVHTPHIGGLENNPAAVERIAKAGVPMMSTLGVFVPHFDAEGKPLFRDGGEFEWPMLPSGGQGPVNARLLFNAGITYAYGTDTSWLPRDSLATELRALTAMFSPREIVSFLTGNAAKAVMKSDRGTLEAGKLADIVLVRQDPLARVDNLLDVAMVIKGGRVVVEKP